MAGATWPGLIGVLALVSALGLLRTRSWAFYTGIVTIVLAVVKTASHMVATRFDPGPAIAIVMFLFMLDYWCRKPARCVFFSAVPEWPWQHESISKPLQNGAPRSYPGESVGATDPSGSTVQPTPFWV